MASVVGLIILRESAAEGTPGVSPTSGSSWDAFRPDSMGPRGPALPIPTHLEAGRAETGKGPRTEPHCGTDPQSHVAWLGLRCKDRRQSCSYGWRLAAWTKPCEASTPRTLGPGAPLVGSG